VPGTTPTEAVQRLQRYQEEFAIRWRKYELYSGGEELFALKQTPYAKEEKKKERDKPILVPSNLVSSKEEKEG
jgi:dynein heavy chain